MATTINAANISIGMDMTRLKSGMGASRAEISQLRSILKDSIDPVDKLRSQTELLSRAFHSGAIDADQYARSMDHLKKKINEAQSAGKGEGFLTSRMKSMAAGAAGGFTLASAFGNVQDLDAINDKAEQLGVSFQDLLVIGRTFEESGGLSFDQAGQALSKMQVNLANARDKGGDLSDMLQRVGLSAGSLANMDAVSAFQEINRSFSQITGQADRMQFATALFGKAGIDMVPALQIGADKFGEMQSHLDSVGLLSDDLPSKVSRVSDEVVRLTDAWKSLSVELVDFFSPLVDAAKKAFEPWMEIRKAIQGENVSPMNLIMKEMGVKSLNTDEIASMSAEERAAWEDQWAQAMANHIRKKKQLEAEQKIVDEAAATFKAYNEKRALEKKAELDAATAREELAKAEERKNEKISQDIDKNLLRMTEQDISSLESERQRLLASGDKNVAATIAPAIKAGTVEAYKAVNQQNEERVARQEQAKRLDEIKQELQKLNAEKTVMLTKVR